MSMLQIKPVLSALKRHKAGTTLIVLQVALTLAIICNALFIIEKRIERMSQPTGMIESNLLTIQNYWAATETKDIPSLTKADLLALRQLPGVEDATWMEEYPLYGYSSTEGIRLDPNARQRIALAQEYFTDDHALATIGARLIAGRNFRDDEIRFLDPSVNASFPQVIVTKALADKVYPNGSALGKPIYIGNNSPSPSTVIGIIERLQAASPTSSHAEYSVLLPALLSRKDGNYLVRSKPGQLDAMAKDAPAALTKLDRMRTFSQDNAIRTFNVVREQAYKSDRGMAILMTAICAVLLLVTAAGIVGLTSFWVAQRRKQIGVRRALGATQGDILGYFLTENLLIVLGGIALGIALAIGLNVWMIVKFEMTMLSLKYLFASAVTLILLGQGAVLMPALRASRVPPIEVIRMSSA
jgi:putative ABC transport system permease protein